MNTATYLYTCTNERKGGREGGRESNRKGCSPVSEMVYLVYQFQHLQSFLLLTNLNKGGEKIIQHYNSCESDCHMYTGIPQAGIVGSLAEWSRGSLI